VALFPALSEYVWAIVIFLLMSLLLWRGLYEDLETMVLVLVASFSLVVIGSVLMLQGTSYAINGAEIASGFRFAMPADGAFVALALMGSVGATAVELFMYPYWIKEKGYPDFVGPREDTAAWRARYRGWMRVLTADALVCTAIALFITCAYYLFMFGGFCTLFSTLLVFAASSGRVGVDFLHQVGMRSLDKGENYARWIRFLQVGFPFLWLLFILVDPRTLDFVLKGANANNMLLIPLAYAVLHLAMRARAEERMSLWGELALLVTIWAIISFTAINLIQLFSS
jgi:hypothetical protein